MSSSDPVCDWCGEVADDLVDGTCPECLEHFEGDDAWLNDCEEQAETEDPF